MKIGWELTEKSGEYAVKFSSETIYCIAEKLDHLACNAIQG